MKVTKLLMVLLCFFSIQLFAQQKKSNSKSKAESKSQISLKELVQTKSSDYVITAEHTSSTSRVHHMYLRQAINGLEVYGTESSLHLEKNGSVIMDHNNFLEDVQSTVISNSASLSSEQAISSVANQMGYKISNLQQLKNEGGINQKAVYTKSGVSTENIPVKLMYYYRPGLGTIKVWELSIAEIDSDDWWNFRVDASSGVIIDKNNFTHYCNILGDHSDHDHSIDVLNKNQSFIGPLKETETINSFSLASGYRVYAMPVESPDHGSRSLELDPDNAIASPFGWHDTDGNSGAEFTYTRGNNVYASEDRDGDNVPGYSPEGGPTLTFDFPIDLSQPPLVNEDANITNLFYWNNIIHDVMYQYGFDEASGNFQENNYSNGGLGSDSVNADAQNPGDCNANFGTPSDGGNPRMQMFLCSNSSPSHDGDLDNMVIVHEYGHGISNRLTGGAGASGCLGNQEQMGEGWSDYYGLMLTMESGDTGPDSRSVGTYLFGQPITGPGIRPHPYSTNFAVNPHTYDDIKTVVAPHGVGSVWAMMVWEMTWEIMATEGFDPDIYNGTAGNNIAIALVTEGLKLQPCSPGFVDGRDAILAADQVLYAGAYQCQIWDAFARRGLGFSADQGSTGSKADGTEAFDLPPTFSSFDTQDEVCLADGVQTGLTGGSPAGGTYTGTGVTDNGDGTYTFDPNATGAGLATITYTVNDFCTGTPTALTDDINVTDDPPVIVCKGSGTLPMSGNVSISPGTPITDNNTITSVITVTDNIVLTDLDVDLNINHTWISDLVITLQSPTGTTITIFDPPSCNGDDLITLLDDEAPTSSTSCNGTGSNTAFPDPSYQPFSALSAFDGENAMGDWTISISDNATGDPGILNSWGLFYSYEVVSLPLDVTLDGSGNATVNAGDLLESASVACGGYTVTAGAPPAATVSFTTADIGLNNVDVFVTSDTGQVSTCTAIINVIAGAAVTFTAPADMCNDAGVQAGLGGGLPTGGVYSGPGVTDDGNGMTYSFDPAAAGVGVHTLTYTNAGSATDDVEVFALPSVAFTALPDLFVNSGVQSGLGGGTPIGGVYSGPGVTDDGNGMTYSFDPAAAGVGVHILTYSFTDSNGCSNNASDNVEVFPASSVTYTAPADMCIDAGVQAGLGAGLPTGGVYSGPGVTDDGNGLTYSFDPAVAGVGVHTLTYTNAGSASDDVEVFALPVVAFNAPADLCLDAGVQTGLGGGTPPQGTVVGDSGVYSGTGVTDDGNGTTYSFDPAAAGVGVHTLTYDYTDENGCSASASDDVEVFALPVVAFTAPASPFCPNTTQTGLGGGTPQGGVYSGSGVTDDANGMTYTFDSTTSGTGVITITYTYIDPNGCTVSASGDVTVEDNVPPAAICQDVTVQLDADGNGSITATDVDNGSNDNCGIASFSVSPSNFTCANVGGNTVTLTVTDVNGNVATCTATATVEDNIDPIIGCTSDITAVTEGGDCGAIVNFQNAVGFDNCGSVTVYQTAGFGSGSVFPVGDTLIEFTAQDDNNNISTCTFTITVEDDDAPNAVCQSITVQLDDNGDATITADQVNFGSNDNCGVDTLEIDMDTFNCSHVGDNNVILTVTDVNGNTATCTAVVTVEDVTAPVVACQDIIVELGADGTITIDPMDVDAGSSDACGIATYELNIDTFDCLNVGNSTVILTVTDVNGNESSCSATVTVEDNTAPELVCMDVTLELNEDGIVYIIPSQLVETINDPCGVLVFTADVDELYCSDIGTPVTVNIFANDGNGNSSFCSSIVTVVDVLAPQIVCPDNEQVNLDADGTYTLGDYIGDGIATVSDNCTDPVTIFSQDPAPGTTLGFGVQVVTFTAEDEYGNVSTCSFELDVQEILGANDTEDFSSLVLYPNPADSQVNLSNPRQMDLSDITIYDLTGRIVNKVDLTNMGSEITIDVSKLANAPYLIVIKGSQGTSNKTLIVNNY